MVARAGGIRWGRVAAWSVGVTLAVLATGACLVTQPVRLRTVELSPDASAERLERDLRHLVEGIGPRGDRFPDNLDRAADFIAAEFDAAGARVERQRYDGLEDVGGHPDGDYQNVIARFGPAEGPRLVVGAHYDTAHGLPGADDNTSGTVGLLELARLLGDEDLPMTVELVAYSTEEPPHFRTPHMGSRVHARSLVDEGVEVRAMVCLEMIGRFDDAPGSQTFPSAALGLLYPNRGDFVALVSKMDSGRLIRRSKRAFMRGSDLPVRSINAPPSLPGIDFSDHQAYWDAGVPALMVTDTAFFRNFDYHTEHDTPDRLDYESMAKVVDGVYAVVLELVQGLNQ